VFLVEQYDKYRDEEIAKLEAQIAILEDRLARKRCALEELRTTPDFVLRHQSLYDKGEKPIEELDLSVRLFNRLRREGYWSIEEVVKDLKADREAFFKIRGFGQGSYDELLNALRRTGYFPSQNNVIHDDAA
jgi:DNA-directed RNA polymerase alpha subunit